MPRDRKNMTRVTRPSPGNSKTSKREPVNTDPYENIENYDDIENTSRKEKQKRAAKRKPQVPFENDVSKTTSKIKTKLESRFHKVLEDDSDSEDIKSVFEEGLAPLRSMLDSKNDNLRIDQASAIFFRIAFSMITDILPLAEKAYRKNQKESAAYALTALINQARDLTADVQRTEDPEGQILRIKQIIDFTIKGMAQMLLQEKFAFNTKVDGITQNTRIRKELRRELDEMVMSYAKGLQEHSALLNDRIQAFMLGEVNYMNPNSEEAKPVRKRRSKKKEHL